MLTPRDRIRIPLIFVGIVLTVASAAVAVSEMREGHSDYIYRFGAWKDLPIAVAAPKGVAPWMIGAGITALVIAYATRDR